MPAGTWIKQRAGLVERECSSALGVYGEFTAAQEVQVADTIRGIEARVAAQEACVKHAGRGGESGE